MLNHAGLKLKLTRAFQSATANGKEATTPGTRIWQPDLRCCVGTIVGIQVKLYTYAKKGRMTININVNKGSE